MALASTPGQGTDRLIDFRLKGTDERMYSLEDIRGQNGTLLMFICNHCPYVKAVIGRLNDDCRALQAGGIGCAAIMPNDAARYPGDSFDNMKLFAAQHSLVFPYLFDETQKTARAYGAVCTPDQFGFNADGERQYRGRVDAAGAREPVGNERRELREAMLQVASTGKGPVAQMPSIGCSIKWRE